MISYTIMAKHDLGETIRRTFRKSGLSMKQLSERAGVPYAGIHGLIVGNSDARLSTASKVCKVLRLQLAPEKRK